MSRSRVVEWCAPQDIQVKPGRRSIDGAIVDRLVESIGSIGLRTPITIRLVDGYAMPDGDEWDGVPVLVTGAHRLEAVKRLGWKEVECWIFDSDSEVEAELWEIAENLHRAELSTLERSEQIARWVELVEQQGVLRQVDAKPQGGRPEGGVRAASRELGINEQAARRAVNIAAISDEAKEEIRRADSAITGRKAIADTQSSLERVAKADDQVAEVRKIAEERRAIATVVDEPQEVRDCRAIRIAWDRACPEARARFMEEVGLIRAEAA